MIEHGKPPLSTRKAGDDPFGCRRYRPHPTSWIPPCYGKQVGEVAPAPRLDVRGSMVLIGSKFNLASYISASDYTR
jgi:hypothetical protein